MRTLIIAALVGVLASSADARVMKTLPAVTHRDALTVLGALKAGSGNIKPRKQALVQMLHSAVMNPRKTPEAQAEAEQIFAPIIAVRSANELEESAKSGELDMDVVLDEASDLISGMTRELEVELNSAKNDYGALEQIRGRARALEAYGDYEMIKDGVQQPMAYEIASMADERQRRIVAALTDRAEDAAELLREPGAPKLGPETTLPIIVKNAPEVLALLARTAQPLRVTNLALLPAKFGAGDEVRSLQEEAVSVLNRMMWNRPAQPTLSIALDGLVRIGRETPYEAVKSKVLEALGSLANHPAAFGSAQVRKAIAEISRQSQSLASPGRIASLKHADRLKLDSKKFATTADLIDLENVIYRKAAIFGVLIAVILIVLYLLRF